MTSYLKKAGSHAANHGQCETLLRRFLAASVSPGQRPGAAGLARHHVGASSVSAAARAAGAAGFGKAKSVIVLHLYGAASQMDTFDPKPDAPQETRGEFRTIATRLPGVRVCEHLPHIATMLDRVALVRSMTHSYPTHAVSYTLSGTPISDAAIEGQSKDARHWPFFGSVLDHLLVARAGSRSVRHTSEPLPALAAQQPNQQQDARRSARRMAGRAVEPGHSRIRRLGDARTRSRRRRTMFAPCSATLTPTTASPRKARSAWRRLGCQPR